MGNRSGENKSKAMALAKITRLSGREWKYKY